MTDDLPKPLTPARLPWNTTKSMADDKSFFERRPHEAAKPAKIKVRK